MSAPIQHLLIVDDDKEIGALLSKFLGNHGYRVSVAPDGNAMMIEEDPHDPAIIKTVRSGGYLFAAPVIRTGAAE